MWFSFSGQLSESFGKLFLALLLFWELLHCFFPLQVIFSGSLAFKFTLVSLFFHYFVFTFLCILFSEPVSFFLGTHHIIYFLYGILYLFLSRLGFCFFLKLSGSSKFSFRAGSVFSFCLYFLKCSVDVVFSFHTFCSLVMADFKANGSLTNQSPHIVTKPIHFLNTKIFYTTTVLFFMSQMQHCIYS